MSRQGEMTEAGDGEIKSKITITIKKEMAASAELLGMPRAGCWRGEVIPTIGRSEKSTQPNRALNR